MSQDGIIDLTRESSLPALASDGSMCAVSTGERSTTVIDLSELPDNAGARSESGPSKTAGPSVWLTTPIEAPVSVTGSLDHVPPIEQHAVTKPHMSTPTIEIDDDIDTPHTAAEDVVVDEQVLLMLVGLVGAGKVSRISVLPSIPSRDAR